MSIERAISKAMLKLSSALNNLDSLTGMDDQNKHFQGKFKRDFHKFLDFFCHHTAVMSTEMYKAEPGAWKEVAYGWMEELDDCVDASTEELKQIACMYAKINSAMGDLKQLDKQSIEVKLFAAPLINRASVILTQGYVKRLPVDHTGMKRLCEVCTEIGNEAVI